MLSLLIQILRTEGILGAFKGFSANMLNTFSQRQSASAYAALRRAAHRRRIRLLLLPHLAPDPRNPPPPTALSFRPCFTVDLCRALAGCRGWSPRPDIHHPRSCHCYTATTLGSPSVCLLKQQAGPLADAERDSKRHHR